MDKKKLFLQYIEEVFMIFGIMIMIMNVLCFIFGESAKGISQLFIFGNKVLRTSINMWEPWLLFGISFGISFLIGCVVNVRKERLENEKMARALEELKRSVDNEESNRNDRC